MHADQSLRIRPLPAAVPLAPLYRQPAVQNAMRAAITASAAWLAAAPVASVYLSTRTGMRVRVRRVGVAGWRPVLRGVTLLGPNRTPLASARVVTMGRAPPPPVASDADTSPRRAKLPGLTATDVTFTVAFAASDLRASNWTSAETSGACGAPIVALTGSISLAVTVTGPPVRTVRMTPFGKLRLPPVHGMSACADLVRRLTRSALRYDARSLPNDLQPAARRIAREAIAGDVESARKTTASAVRDLREAARKVDAVLDGLPDLQHYRDFARQSESLLGSLARWLGNPDREAPPAPATEKPRGPIQGYRILDESTASN